jgi:hypothetical protein
MPDRRHLWRGIHDPETVQSGVIIDFTTKKSTYRAGETLQAALRIANSGVGHYFPTYVTPRVVVRFELLGKDGQPMPDTQKEAVIGREVPLDLSDELFDTRIRPGDTVTINYSQKVLWAGLTLRATVTVEPDYFYSKFFRAILDGGQVAKGRAHIQQALQRTQDSPFVIFKQEIPLR